MIAFLDNALFSLTWPLPLLIIVVSMLVFAVAAYLAKSLDFGGAAGAFVMGVVVLWLIAAWQLRYNMLQAVE